MTENHTAIADTASPGTRLCEALLHQLETRLPGVLDFVRPFAATRTALIGCGMLALLILVSVIPSLIAPQDPFSQDIMQSLKLPSANHILGTDVVGRDVLSRLIYGVGPSMFMTLASVLIGGTIGCILGVVAGYFGGLVETVLMRFNDLLFSLPSIVVALVTIAIAGPGLNSLIFALSFLSVPSFARIVHGCVITLRDAEYIWAARSVGAPTLRILIRHVLPNVATPSVTLAPIVASTNLIVGSSLSFFGLGVQPPAPELGLLAAEGRQYVWVQPYLAWAPGLVVLLAAASLNLTGQGLRNALDPHSRQLPGGS